ncbi:MAG: hypothetical protein LKF31_00245 [Muribaculaceae bacterium]|jgi:hypothetical protein|nr:hypothetical protein [Muribaculaceae bacterium]
MKNLIIKSMLFGGALIICAVALNAQEPARNTAPKQVVVTTKTQIPTGNRDMQARRPGAQQSSNMGNGAQAASSTTGHRGGQGVSTSNPGGPTSVSRSGNVNPQNAGNNSNLTRNRVKPPRNLHATEDNGSAVSNSKKTNTGSSFVNRNNKTVNAGQGNYVRKTEPARNYSKERRFVKAPVYQQGHYLAPPTRAYRLNNHPISRPYRPSNYSFLATAPRINSVLGLSFGTAIGASLTSLYNNNYIIDGYTDQTIYLRGASEQGYVWDDAELNYSSGVLVSAQFSYSTEYDDISRYNTLHYNLCRTYGDPVAFNYNGGETCASWYGQNGIGYVTLEYFIQNDRYYTVLSYSNN